ncbi:MAG: hypothetical protein U9N63_10435 [Pseudomonadota bacterium]|nr:hypothetical protein [Pseudomonadota bacterium]
MENKNEIPNVTSSNTKKELLDAYMGMKEILKNREREILNAQKAREKAEKQAALATAQKEAKNDPIQRIHDLRTSLGKELAGLAERFESEMETFNKVTIALEEKQVELKTLYEIEAAASDLAILIEAQQERKLQFDNKMKDSEEELDKNIKESKAAFDSEINEKREQWKKEKLVFESRLKEEQEELTKRRKRDEEEYQYKLKREHELKQNQLSDDLQKIEREISDKQETFALETGQRLNELEQRDKIVSEREQAMDELNARVAGFSAEKEKAISQAVKEVSERLQERFDSEKSLMMAEFAGEKRVLENSVVSLEKLVESMRTQIDQLAQKQESAYEKVQNIANRAVDAARREIITVPTVANKDDREN